MDYPDLPAVPGTYALIFEAPVPVTLCIGALGVVKLERGRYAYVGSAQGSGGLKARVSRHLRTEKRMHWHVDYLAAVLPVTHVIAAASYIPTECVWVQRLLGLPGADVPVARFGSGDCHGGCPAHLVRLPDNLEIARLERLLRQMSQ